MTTILQNALPNSVENSLSPTLGITVIILTFNSDATLRRVVRSCHGLAKRILIVDSFSSDLTLEIAKAESCEIIQHAFENYSLQRNWAQEYAQLKPQDWVLHLDSDEVLTPELATEIQRVMQDRSSEVSGYLIRRLSFFLGHPIRFGHINPSWHLRLFRANSGQCEERLYDQHFISSGSTQRLRGVIHDLQLVSIESWTTSHNRWSTAEALQISRDFIIKNSKVLESKTLDARLDGDIRMKKRWMKNNFYYRCPLFLRSAAFFMYSYFLRLGFLDGRAGLIYHVLQAFWFRFLVDAKIFEMTVKSARRDHANPDLRD